MEILVPSNAFATPSSPSKHSSSPYLDSMLHRRSSRQHISTLSLSAQDVTVERTPLSPVTAPSNCHSLRTNRVYGFLPLPPIAASPVCTPPTSEVIISPQQAFRLDCGPEPALALTSPAQFTGAADYLTAPTASASMSSLPSSASVRMSHLPPPTWISTPPTPPAKLVRRSVTCVTRRTPSTIVSPSATFPASLSTHAPSPDPSPISNCFQKPTRHASLPSMRLTPYPSSLAFDFPAKSDPRAASPLRATSTAPKDHTDAKDMTKRAPKCLFHIEHDVSDSEDIVIPRSESPGKLTNEELGSEEGTGSSTDYEHLAREWSREKSKDDIRKHYALMELLTTEVGYLLDLRVLVSIYLRNISTLTSRYPTSGNPFGRTTSTFGSSRGNSYAYMNTSPMASAAIFQEQNPHASPNHQHHGQNCRDGEREKDKEKAGPARRLFSDIEIGLLKRNAEEVLQLHEHFVEELRSVVTPLGYSMDFSPSNDGHTEPLGVSLNTDNVDAAIGVVSTKFATEASRFNSYESFCTGHPEALDLVRKVQQQFPVEWEGFEQRCSSLVSEMIAQHEPKSGSLEISGAPKPEPRAHNPLPAEPHIPNGRTGLVRKRTHSLTSMDNAVRSLRFKTNIGGGSRETEAIPPLPLEFTSGRVRSEKTNGSHRLVFTDYMIKPVQRICKYPLLLDQLKMGKSLRIMSMSSEHHSQSNGIVRSDVNVVVESATQAMRHVASMVNEARHRHDIVMQSSLIVSRISQQVMSMSSAGVPVTSYTTSSMHPPYHTLKSAFLASLGTCLLAGSLDVIHSHPYEPPTNGNIKAKYLGAFLYMGGYFVLVKVCKGRIYEPRHWFPLGDFDVIDVREEDAMLPCSFRLSCYGHQFELAAACQLEKDAWLSCIRESLAHLPRWTNEPPSSLQVDGKREHISPPSDALSTIQSIPEPTGPDDRYDQPKEQPSGESRAGIKQSKSNKADRQTPSRRGSSASVKAIFSPTSESNMVIIRRSSPTARAQVDYGLQDIISEPCLTARSYASNHEEDLFQAPRATRSAFTRSNSGLSMTGMGIAAKNRLTRHESVRVPRRKSLHDDGVQTESQKTVSRVKSIATRRHRKKLSIISMSEVEGTLVTPSSEPSSESPTPYTQESSSITVSNPSSISSSSVLSVVQLPPAMESREGERKPKRPQSIRDNMRGLFHSRPNSPVPFYLRPPTQISSIGIDLDPKDSNKTLTPGLLKRWATAPLHRRVRSAPDAPKPVDSKSTSTPKRSGASNSSNPDAEFGTDLLYCRSNEVDDSHQSCQNTSTRRLSLLSHSPFSSSVYTDPRHPPRGHRTLSLLHRLKSKDAR